MHQCYSVTANGIDGPTAEFKGASSAFVCPSAGVRRHAVFAQTRNAVNQEESSGLQSLDYCSHRPHRNFSGLDRSAGLRWIGIEASELLLPRQHTAAPRMLRFLNKIFGNIPQYRSYIEAHGREEVFAISLQLPLDILQKLLPTRHTMSLRKHATVLDIPNFLLLPQALSIAATALCLSEQLADSLVNQHQMEKILSLVLVKTLEVWTVSSSKSGSKIEELCSIDPAAPNQLLFRPSIRFRIEAVSSLSCVLALECYSQLMQRIGACCRSFLSCDLQLVSALLACATCACMPNSVESESNSTKAPQHSNFHPRHAAFLSLRLTSLLEIVSQSFACLRAATKFSPAIDILLHNPFSNYSFSVEENLQNRLNRVIRTNRDPFHLNKHTVWKSSCSILAQDFNQIMFSPFNLAIRWLK